MRKNQNRFPKRSIDLFTENQNEFRRNYEAISEAGFDSFGYHVVENSSKLSVFVIETINFKLVLVFYKRAILLLKTVETTLF